MTDDQGPDFAAVARQWWQELQPNLPDGRRNYKGDRGALARLRRVSDPRDALGEPAVLDLYRRMGFGRADVARMEWVAVVAVVLAGAREVGSVAPAAAIGRQQFSSKTAEDDPTALMKPIRFRRLLQARTPEEVLRAFRRLVDLARDPLRKPDVGRLARAILLWFHPVHGERERARWTFDYFAAGAAAPTSDVA